MLRRTGNQGSAVVAALMVVALVASLLLLIQVTHRASIERASDIIRFEKASTYALGIEQWAIGRLSDYQALPLELRAKQAWPIQFDGRTEEGNIISGEITDQQALFNLNSLNNINNKIILVHILNNITPNNAEILAEKMRLLITSRASEDALTQFRFINELREMKEFNDEQLRTLAQYATFLPAADTSFNINTANPNVIAAFLLKPTTDKINAIMDARRTNGAFINANEIMNFSPLITKADFTGKLDTVSNYFLVHAHVIRQETELDMTSLISVVSDDTNIRVSVIWRSQSSF